MKGVKAFAYSTVKYVHGLIMSCLLHPIFEVVENFKRLLSGGGDASDSADDIISPLAEEEKWGGGGNNSREEDNPSSDRPNSPQFKNKQRHTNKRREKLHKYTVKTLGSGDVWKAVALPDGESKFEWISVHTVDFFNELSLLYGAVAEDAQARFPEPGQGFPQGYVYMWPTAGGGLAELSAPAYVDRVMGWAEDALNDPRTFPQSQHSRDYPEDFEAVCRSLFKRLFRVFAIIYCQHFELIEELHMEAHLNTSFKHFLFFCLEFHLVEEKEFRPLEPIVQRIKAQFQNRPQQSENSYS
mmetsp:Transcript_40556/g.59760  ORF Transcript_40556/g.59760 Transcript_40556/m.59760 type:complete len:298 (-) Transcript_40556:152-1045(-)